MLSDNFIPDLLRWGRSLIHMRKIFCFTTLFCITLINIEADNVWTLEMCTDYALSHNLTVKSMILAEESARNGIQSNLFELAPTIGITSDAGRGFDKKDYSDNWQINAEATITFSTGLKHLNGHRRAGSTLRSAQYSTIWERKIVSSEITAAYLEAILATELLKAAKNNVSVVIEQNNHMKLLVEAGRLPHSGIGQMEAQEAAERLSLVEAECNLEEALLNLQTLMELPYDENFAIAIPDNSAIISNQLIINDSTLIGRFIAKNSRILASQEYLKSSKLERKEIIGSLFPTLSITGSYGTGYTSLLDSGIKIQLEENLNPAFGVTLYIPIIPASEKIYAIKESNLAVNRAEIELEQSKIETEQMIRNMLLNAVGSHKKMMSAKTSLASAKELMEENMNKLNSGAISALDWIISRNKYQNAESAWIQAKWQYFFNLKSIELFIK